MATISETANNNNKVATQSFNDFEYIYVMKSNGAPVKISKNDFKRNLNLIGVQGRGNNSEVFNQNSDSKPLAPGQNAHAEGRNTHAEGGDSHAEGNSTWAKGGDSHTEGQGTETNTQYSHAEGFQTRTFLEGGKGGSNHAEGARTKAYGWESHAEGADGEAHGEQSHTEGSWNYAYGHCSHAGGKNNKAYHYCSTVIGYNNPNTDSNTGNRTGYNSNNTALAIGADGKTAFKVKFNGETSVNGTVLSRNADYAEMFEWIDGNIYDEDRTGRFVTFQIGTNKIRFADSTDPYIIGIVSATPVILGDNPDYWHKKYLTDEWGKPIYENVVIKTMNYHDENCYLDYPKEVNETIYTEKLNSNYDDSQTYIPRSERQEWSAIGLLGKLIVKQDGTLHPGCFCYPGKDGIATKSDYGKGYYVMEVLSEDKARVLFK